MTAQGRLSGLVLTVLPFIVGSSLFFLNPEYFGPMLERTTGHYMLAYALFSIGMGHMVIRRLVRVQV